MTKLSIHLLCTGAALGALFISAPAFADALPPSSEDCAGGSGGQTPVGGACSLHDTANTPGTCQNTTCTHTPNPSLCDAGGMGENCGPVQEPCVLCIAGGGDGGPAAGDGGSTTAGDGGTTGKSSSGGCAVNGSDTSPLSMLLPLGLAALVPLALRRKNKKGNTAE